MSTKEPINKTNSEEQVDAEAEEKNEISLMDGKHYSQLHKLY